MFDKGYLDGAVRSSWYVRGRWTQRSGARWICRGYIYARNYIYYLHIYLFFVGRRVMGLHRHWSIVASHKSTTAILGWLPNRDKQRPSPANQRASRLDQCNLGMFRRARRKSRAQHKMSFQQDYYYYYMLMAVTLRSARITDKINVKGLEVDDCTTSMIIQRHIASHLTTPLASGERSSSSSMVLMTALVGAL